MHLSGWEMLFPLPNSHVHSQHLLLKTCCLESRHPQSHRLLTAHVAQMPRRKTTLAPRLMNLNIFHPSWQWSGWAGPMGSQPHPYLLVPGASRWLTAHCSNTGHNLQCPSTPSSNDFLILSTKKSIPSGPFYQRPGRAQGDKVF